MADGPEYSELGQVLDELARKRKIRGPYKLANYIRRRMGHGPNGSAWSQIYRGETGHPQPRTIQLFVEALGLTPEEKAVVADAYLFPRLIAA